MAEGGEQATCCQGFGTAFWHPGRGRPVGLRDEAGQGGAGTSSSPVS